MDFRASLQVWRRVLMQPGEAVFAEELAKPYARWGTAVIWLFGAGLVAVLVWLLIFLLLDPIGQSLTLMPEFLAQMGATEAAAAEMMAQMEQTAEATMFMILCALLIGVPGVSLLWSGLLWLIAKLLGGTGSFEKQSFLLASFIAPLVMVGVLVYILPLLGPIMMMFLAGYTLYLTYFALKVVHGLPSGKAATAVLTPAVALFAVGCCAVTLWFSLVAAMLGTMG